jgi:predicted PurR-regulated permease PerM
VLVGGVFTIGSIIEGQLLSPNLVGGRIGLHPVWVIFALLAGGSMLGFIGMLLALPTAAIIGVLVRYSIARYLVSPLYLGDEVKVKKL